MITEQKSCFQFKASFSPCTILQITDYDLPELEKQIEATIARAPNIFLGSPVVIDLDKIPIPTDIDFTRLKHLLIKVGLAPMGVRGGTGEQSIAAASVGLPLVNVGKTATNINHIVDKIDPAREVIDSIAARKASKTFESPVSDPEAIELTEPGINLRTSLTKIINQPVRSGMQVYSKDADLIIVGQVSPGAELLADGNIHIYGALRGRALAGLSGNMHARIFCRTLEAELVSIAGFYLTKEDIQALPTHHGMIQIYLENEQVKIEAL